MLMSPYKDISTNVYVCEETHDSPHNCHTIALLLLLGDPRECGGNGHWERDYEETKTARKGMRE